MVSATGGAELGSARERSGAALLELARVGAHGSRACAVIYSEAAGARDAAQVCQLCWVRRAFRVVVVAALRYWKHKESDADLRAFAWMWVPRVGTAAAFAEGGQPVLRRAAGCPEPSQRRPGSGRIAWLMGLRPPGRRGSLGGRAAASARAPRSPSGGTRLVRGRAAAPPRAPGRKNGAVAHFPRSHSPTLRELGAKKEPDATINECPR